MRITARLIARAADGTSWLDAAEKASRGAAVGDAVREGLAWDGGSSSRRLLLALGRVRRQQQQGASPGDIVTYHDDPGLAGARSLSIEVCGMHGNVVENDSWDW